MLQNEVARHHVCRPRHAGPPGGNVGQSEHNVGDVLQVSLRVREHTVGEI